MGKELETKWGGSGEEVGRNGQCEVCEVVYISYGGLAISS